MKITLPPSFPALVLYSDGTEFFGPQITPDSSQFESIRAHATNATGGEWLPVAVPLSAVAALPECLQALADLYKVVADNAELLHEQGVHPDSFNHPLDAARAALLKAGATIAE